MQQFSRVCHLLSSLKVGGAERFVIDLSTEQQKMGHQVTIISFGSKKDELYNIAKKAGVHVIVLSKKWFNNNKLTLNELTSFDVIHLHSPVILKAILVLLPFLHKQKVIYTRHGEGHYNSTIWSIVHWLAKPFMSAITFVSYDGKKVFQTDHGWSQIQQQVIENGICIENECSSPNRTNSNKLRLGSVGRMVPLKGQHDLITAWSKLPIEIQKNIEIHLIGDGESRAFLEKKVTDLGASSSIYFHGFVTDRDSISNLFDMLVVNSESEGLSIAILEAMAKIKPVIATNVGGNPRLVINNKTGMLYEFGDVNCLTDLIVQYYENKDLIIEHGVNAREYVKENYSLTSTANKYDLLYKI